jgi:hypothetical protein
MPDFVPFLANKLYGEKYWEFLWTAFVLRRSKEK